MKEVKVLPQFQPSAYNKWIGEYFDSSWELGGGTGDFGSLSSQSVPYDNSHGAGTGITVISGAADPAVYSSHRWFEGVDQSKNAASSEVNDPAKLKCHVCNVQQRVYNCHHSRKN